MSSDDIPPEYVVPHADSYASLEDSINCLDTVIALYDFPGTQPSHLSLDLGDTVYVLSKHESGWWDGVLVNQKAEVLRGWFPENYVRSVNYVQPVLSKLQSNKEIDSITAANTAANVLIPQFTSLLQKSPLSLDFPRDSSSNTRKNSVVSFALSDTGPVSNESKTPLRLNELKYPLDPPLSNPVHQPSFASTISLEYSSSASFAANDLDVDKIQLLPLEEVEAKLAELKEIEQKNVIWIPRLTDNGDLAYYCETLNIYCSRLPLSPMVPESDLHDMKMSVPSKAAIDDYCMVTKLFPTITTSTSNSRTSSLAKSYEPRKHSSSSTISQSSASSYHNFDQPFFSMPGFFYKQFLDLSYWTELDEKFDQILKLTWKALKESSTQLFTMHLSTLTKIISIVMTAARLTQSDFSGSKFEKSIRHKLRRLSEAFSQMYINSLLHLSVMHYADAGEEYANFDIYGLNKSTSSTAQGSYVSSSNSDGTTGGGSTVQNPSQLIINESIPYLESIKKDIGVIKSKFNRLTQIFLSLSANKMVLLKDYDGSENSNDIGQERYNILPQVYPRFITNEFNGGNWCNPFFGAVHPFLNASGDQLKNKYHSKLVIDSTALERCEVATGELESLSEKVLGLLSPEKQHLYYNETLKTQRNERILQLMYKYLHHVSILVDTLELLDFTVFCLIRRNSSVDVSEDRLLTDVPETAGLTFDYPAVLEFFQYKQLLHENLAKIITYSQSLTLEDPDSFSVMKDDEAVLYAREAMKDSLEKSAIFISNILFNQNKRNAQDRISFSQDHALADLLIKGTNLRKDILASLRILIEERESIINYSTRVMHDDFSVDLIVAERNNTSAGVKPEDIGNHYISGKQKNEDTPWFLEGDDEFDLLLDMNGSIKGGTKEALVAHLTYHESVDTSFNSVFLIIFATILPFSELIHMLVQRFNIEAPEGLSYEEYLTWKKLKQSRVRSRVLNVMRLLAEKYWCSSYRSVPVLKRWLKFLGTPEVQAFPMSKVIIESVKALLDGVDPLKQKLEVKVMEGKVPAPLFKGFTLRKMRLMDIEYVELARQLTIREFKIYCNISKHSCISKVWGKKLGLNEPVSSIATFIKASNQLTNFVAYSILRKDDPRKRVQVIRYFVLVAEKCRQFNNFSSMTAIISALYSSPIHRLKRTWTFVTKDTLTRLQHMNKLMNLSRNFNEYRDMLKFVGSEPCVPFFGMYLSDLTFIFHGNSDHLMNRSRMLNFAKRTKTVNIVLGIDHFKQVGYNFATVPEIQTFIELWFDKCPSIEEQYQLSLNIEPREEPSRSVYTPIGPKTFPHAMTTR